VNGKKRVDRMKRQWRQLLVSVFAVNPNINWWVAFIIICVSFDQRRSELDSNTNSMQKTTVIKQIAKWIINTSLEYKKNNKTQKKKNKKERPSTQPQIRMTNTHDKSRHRIRAKTVILCFRPNSALTGNDRVVSKKKKINW